MRKRWRRVGSSQRLGNVRQVHANKLMICSTSIIFTVVVQPDLCEVVR